MTDDGLPPLREVIKAHGLTAKRSLGQNFILDLNLTRKIASLGGDLAGKTVVEVGPGPGGLTRALLGGGAGRVIGIEQDPRCLAALTDIAAHWPGQLFVHNCDALAMDWSALLAEHGPAHPHDVAIVANLPYGVATKLLIGWLQSDHWPPWYGRMVLMFQREVADRIVAAPGSKAYGRLSVICQWSADVRIALTLPPAAFTPPPKVASAVVVFVPKDQRHPPCSPQTLERITAAVFGQRRKMLRSSLKQLTPFPELVLDKAEIAPSLRGEAVDVAGFARLARALDVDP